MRLKSDEQEALAAIARGEVFACVGRLRSIVKKLESYGFVASGAITARGLHVASSIETPQEQEPDGTIYGQSEPDLADQIDGASVTEDQGIAGGRIVEPGSGPDAEAEKRPADLANDGIHAVSRAGRKARHKP